MRLGDGIFLTKFSLQILPSGDTAELKTVEQRGWVLQPAEAPVSKQNRTDFNLAAWVRSSVDSFRQHIFIEGLPQSGSWHVQTRRMEPALPEGVYWDGRDNRAAVHDTVSRTVVEVWMPSSGTAEDRAQLCLLGAGASEKGPSKPAWSRHPPPRGLGGREGAWRAWSVGVEGGVGWGGVLEGSNLG